ncbi:hypothetical protein OAN307_c15020 [Octadecabacter antarcticus 307]|uniref:DUF112 domain-containing protein n=1 Tax=Octadecabacter antarcticus 307 TaxID=391626 RepID=M9R9W1_9RHOB|nr:tripartite tricarboxylate transporter permease [Octadecabacter antarcticus]AGI67176.1 hypothetical protein OAN307_c15020 [Octadecabacter antarcticus 307]
MEILQNLKLSFSITLSTWTHMLTVTGRFIGRVVGTLPSLGPSNGVAVMIPLTVFLCLDATCSLSLLTSIYYGAMYGGRISFILRDILGIEPAMTTTRNGYPMANAGRAADALVI